jgi:hypothetical protein
MCDSSYRANESGEWNLDPKLTSWPYVAWDWRVEFRSKNDYVAINSLSVAGGISMQKQLRDSE